LNKQGFVDLHNHLIYGMDDGAKSFRETTKMLLQAKNNGVAIIYATPHVVPGRIDFPLKRFLQRVKEANDWCEENDLALSVLSGCEIFYTPETIRFLNEGRIPCLGDTNCVLVEFNPDVSHNELKDAARKLQNSGYQPVIAHAERYRCLRFPGRMAELQSAYGASIQMNAHFVLSRQGFFTEIWKKQVLSKGLIDIIASDSHDTRYRPCCLKKCFDSISAEYGKHTALSLFRHKLAHDEAADHGC